MTTFRQANLQDFNACWAMIDAARWKMLADGRHQWTAEYPSREQITNDIQQGHAYVLANGNDVKAYAVVIANGESAYAQRSAKWLTEGDYMVVHRVAVAMNERGKGYARQLFQNVERLCRERNIHSIKVDTNYDNREMRTLLHRLGFTACGEIDYGAHGMRLAFERCF